MNSEKPDTIVLCPTCSSQVEWNAKSLWRPFCCERCKLIDLGEWADESYRVNGENENDFQVIPKDE